MVYIRRYYSLFFNLLTNSHIKDSKTELWGAHCQIIITLTTGILMWGYTFLAYFTIDHSTPWIVGIIACLVHNLSPLFLRWPGSLPLAANFLIAAGMIHQGIFAYFSGGYLSPILIWFGILPMLGGIMDGIRGVVIWSILTTLTASFLLYLYLFDLFPQNLISNEGIIIGQSMMVFGWIFLSSCIIAAFISFRNSHEKMIKAGLERIASLIRILCHDISNPLMNIKLRTQLLEKKYDLFEEKNSGRIKKSIEDIENIIEQIKLWQSSETGSYKVNVKPFHFGKMIAPLKDQFEEKLNLKNLELHYKSRVGQEDIIIADERIVYGHILSNLLSNAIKFSPHDSVIEITFDNRDGVGVIEVVDYGIGIPCDLISKIFLVDEATNRSGTNGEQGTGFGLPIVKSFVEAMKGTIEIESETVNSEVKNSLTKFIIRLPLKESAENLEA